eukprot:3814244-Pyramimonas_sp.AAC.1
MSRATGRRAPTLRRGVTLMSHVDARPGGVSSSDEIGICRAKGRRCCDENTRIQRLHPSCITY